MKLLTLILVCEGAAGLVLAHRALRLAQSQAAPVGWATPDRTLAYLATLGKAHVPSQPWPVEKAS